MRSSPQFLSVSWLNWVSILPIATNLKTVIGTLVDLVGGILLESSGMNPQTGVVSVMRQLVYVSKTVPYRFLSLEACVDLGLITLS